MVFADFYQLNNDKILFSRQQASRFAKEVANDFNPLHDAEAKMFCVPGDLLFSVALDRLGLSQQMRFTFSGMVSDEAVIFPDSNAEKVDITDAEGKCYLTIERNGEITHDLQLIGHLAKHYVAFSGKTFPHILVPLMSEKGVMINPARPLVIYQKMEITLNRFDLASPLLETADSDFEVLGKKGTARLEFLIKEQGETVGRGAKYMSLRGLQPFDNDAMASLIAEYNGYREEYRDTI
ncbi:MAG: DUF3581 family protein [Chromatiales bacterium]|jgi:hypothetical protein